MEALDDVEIGRRLAAHLRAQGLVDDAALARAGQLFQQGKRSADALVLAGVPANVVEDALTALGITADGDYARTIAESTMLTPPPDKKPDEKKAPAPITLEDVKLVNDLPRIGPWQAEKLLGQGGMARVFLARDREGRRAAVKVVHKHLVELDTIRQRFIREARATMRVRHKNIVEVLDVADGDEAYLAVEYIDGGTVGRLLRKVGAMPLAAALDIFAQMMDGLAAAHAQGIVHRDLKPDNLLVGRDGVVKIADFGIARELDATAMTQTGSTLGTPTYMSPEQVRAQSIDARSDLYTAGLILYVLLVGRNPFEAESIGAVVSQILGGKAPPLFEVAPAVPDSIGGIVASLMQLDRDKRPQSAAQVLEMIAPIVDEERKKQPDLLRELVARPEIAREARQREAEELVAAGRELLQMGPNAREAAGLCLYKATLLDRSNVEAVRLLEGLAKDQGVHFDETKNPKLLEVLAQLEQKPDDPVLLQRAGVLYKQEGNVYRAAVYFRRYLRLRPDDQYIAGQLSRMTMMPTEGVGGTVDRIAGHVHTGGFAAAAPVPPERPVVKVVEAPAQSAMEQNLDAARASFSVHGKKLAAAAAVVVVLVLVVKGVGGMISGAQDQIDNARFGEKIVVRPADVDAERAADANKRADAALDEARWDDALADASACVESTKKPFRTSRCLVLRGRAALGLNRPLAAVEDLTRVVNAYASEEAYAEALIRRGQAHAAAGDPEHAIEDFTRAIDDKPQPNWVALARLERGIAYAARGDTGKAKADLERAADLTSPSMPVHKRALEALAKLP